jgi:starch-binding outer membrane protein, SusD/RagB family
MKNSNNKFHWTLLIPIIILSACSEEFLERPPLDALVDASFYQTDEQVLAGTALLYSKVWHDYNDKASYNIGDFRGGSVFSAYNDRDNVQFNTTANTPENGAAWRAFFNVVGQSNLAIQNINKYAGAEVSPEIKRYAIAEARFMRAVAYRYLVMNWEEVPIIENNLTLLADTSIYKNTKESIWRFITSEMRAAGNDLTETPIREGRVSKWSAEGMLARFYLARSGVESSGGQRNQTFLDSAKYFAKRVIDQSGARLMSNYSELFLFPYDNNSESLFSLQWVFSSYGTSNSTPSYLHYSNDIANGDGWGGDKGATLWMLAQYDGLIEKDAQGNPVYANAADEPLFGKTLDQRLKTTFMLPGAFYPEITQTLNGVDQDLVFPFVDGDVNFASIKKYVVGKAKDVGGKAAQQNYDHDTYMLRLAEMYLVYAEAELGNNASTTDATALQYFNAVHTRAGLPPFEDPLTFDVIFRERVLEFAMEAATWYDLVSLHYYNPEKAYSILNSQDRGFYAIAPDKFPDPTAWSFTPTAWANTNRRVIANDGNFYLPIPAADAASAPNLRKKAVDYYNK